MLMPEYTFGIALSHSYSYCGDIRTAAIAPTEIIYNFFKRIIFNQLLYLYNNTVYT